MILIYFLYFYLFIGLLFALYFVFYKIKKIDELAMHTSLLFKLLIYGGSVLLWPLLITKKKHYSPMTRSLRKYHFYVWIVIVFVLIVAIVLAYSGSVTINQFN